MKENRTNISLDELINELDKRISDLNDSVSQSDAEEDLRAAAIKDKAVNVLNSVKEKAINLPLEASSEQELQSALNMIRDKSLGLYIEAMSKISEIYGDDLASLIFRNKDDRSSDNASEKATDEGTNEVKDKALKVLKGWFFPDGDEQ